MNPHNGQLATELFERVKSRVFEGADHAGPDAVHAHLHNIFNGERQTALNEVVNLQFIIQFRQSIAELIKCFLCCTVCFTKNG